MKSAIYYFKSTVISLLGLSFTSISVQALTINPTNNGRDIVENILGSGITIDLDSINYIGVDNSSATFTDGGVIGIDSGIVLTTGNANDAIAPNLFDLTTTNNDLPGDSDLDSLIPGFSTVDATVLEFDFESEGSDLFFNYVFASEEYNEFTDTLFNDVFGFFLDGENIALIPGTETPVSINTVNGGGIFNSEASNPDLFNNNDLNDPEASIFEIEYDGFTNVLTAQALDLSPGTHTIKLAISDVGDSAYDSAVFIQANSFSSDPRNPSTVPESSSLFGLFTFISLAAGFVTRRNR